MLVVSRRKDESIVIGQGLVTVTVIKIGGDKVRIGVDAPPELSVHRAEVQARIDLEKGKL